MHSLRQAATTLSVREKRGSDDASPWIVASVPACLLAANKFSEVIQLHVAKSGELVGMEYLSPQMANTCPAASDSAIPSGATLSTIVVVGVPNIASPVPKAKGAAPGAPVIKGVDPKAGTEEEGKQSQSFVRKYWYIILPLVLVMSLGGARLRRRVAAEQPAEGDDVNNSACTYSF